MCSQFKKKIVQKALRHKMKELLSGYGQVWLYITMDTESIENLM